eukprot:Nitzschia sp. Nitz4//scaffold84_size84139//17889//22709//NITZ4_005193-RA/size84139-augustus-gene-0.44-mRNA-1//-1//CDS//3329559018//8350//frame0
MECWNFKVCANTVLVDCAFDGKAACTAQTNWMCPNGRHSFPLQLCCKGTPSGCPECMVDTLKQHRHERRCEFVSHTQKKVLEALDPFPKACIDSIGADEDTFTQKENKLLDRTIEMLGTKTNPWERDALRLERIPCMVELDGHKLSKKARSFDPKVFVKRQTMAGMKVKTLCSSNIQKMARESKIILIGIASVVKTYETADGRLPKGSKPRSSLLLRLHRDHFDSIHFKDHKGFDSLILLRDPFPVQAVAVVKFSEEQLELLSQRTGNFQESRNHFAGTISFQKPPTDVVLCSTLNNDSIGPELKDDALNFDDDSVDEIIAPPSEFVGTLLEGCTIDTDWSGGIGVDENQIQNGEVLATKMEFVNRKATPFSAMSQLENQLQIHPDSPELKFLLAAEYLKHSPEKSKELLIQYLTLGRESTSCFRVHPWSIILASRLEPSHAQKLVPLYARIFPAFLDILTSEEKKLVYGLVPDCASDNSPQVCPVWSDQLIQQWQDLKSDNDRRSDAMDRLLELTGLRRVKEAALRLWKSALQIDKMDDKTRMKNLFATNYCFLGNPGTGKTTVARLYASILHDSGIRRLKVFRETTAQKAKDDGADEFRRLAGSAAGGVLFIDEAYDLDPLGDSKGRPIVNELLTLCENERDNISVILAGYESDFDNKFFPYNDGLRSRFTRIMFDDFDESELATIWSSMRSERGWHEGPGVCDVMVRRLLRKAGKKGFGNAREIRVHLEEATQIAMARLGDNFSQSKMVLSVTDVIGQDPRLSNEKLARVRREIEEKVGWKRVKSKIDELVNLCGVNYGRELQNLPPIDICLNRLFLGNPGTGKTTCAKLYGRLLKELGFLSNGDIVSKTASDFIGGYIGQSQTKTVAILEGAKGKVLIIDEAYVLNDGKFGSQVIDTIVEKVQGHATDDMAVLLLGYEEQMLELIRDANPGLARRFPESEAFYFDDYDDNELLQILDGNIKAKAVTATISFRRKALAVLRTERQRQNFGNAGEVEKIVKSALMSATFRVKGSTDSLALEDVDIADPGTARAGKDQDPLGALDKLFRMEEIKARLQGMSKSWAVSKQEGDENPKLGHFVFMGSPGTGKTTVARAVANVLFGLGLLPSNTIVETSALDLTAAYLGQTKDKTKKALKEAKGGVLFVDEAYNLGKGLYGQEAVDTLVEAMTSEKFKDVVVVVAGYPWEMQEMFKSNAGLKSRFTHFFQFPDWEPEDCVTFFKILANRNGFEVDDMVVKALEASCTTLKTLSGWANGRDVTKLWEDAKSARDVREYDNKTGRRVILTSDLSTAIRSMLNARREILEPASFRQCQESTWPAETLDTPPQIVWAQPGFPVQAWVEPKDKEFDKEETIMVEGCDTHDNASTVSTTDGRDEGVPDEVWEELQERKLAEAEEQAELKRQEARIQEIQTQLESEECQREQLHVEKERLEQLQAFAEAEKRLHLEAEAKRIQEEQRRMEEEQRALELERQYLEEQRRLILEEEQKRQQMKQKLRMISPCPVGYDWTQVGGGWRCAGGSHFVSTEELHRRFGCDV